jgi:hypothetical protein
MPQTEKYTAIAIAINEANHRTKTFYAHSARGTQ